MALRRRARPLRLRRIDSGAGALRIDPRRGVTVAEVQVDLGRPRRAGSANPTKPVPERAPRSRSRAPGCPRRAGRQLRPAETRWANGLLGRGVNYTVCRMTTTMSWSSPVVWRRNGANLPAPLTLLAADVGSGLVAIGATEARKGIRVATIFECPKVNPQPLPRSSARTAPRLITGGFTRSDTRNGFGGEVKIDFEPALKVGVDYMLRPSTARTCSRREGRAWRRSPARSTSSAWTRARAPAASSPRWRTSCPTPTRTLGRRGPAHELPCSTRRRHPPPRDPRHVFVCGCAADFLAALDQGRRLQSFKGHVDAMASACSRARCGARRRASHAHVR